MGCVPRGIEYHVLKLERNAIFKLKLTYISLHLLVNFSKYQFSMHTIQRISSK